MYAPVFLVVIVYPALFKQIKSVSSWSSRTAFRWSISLYSINSNDLSEQRVACVFVLFYNRKAAS